MLKKQRRYRSKAFMKFCHEEMKPAPCCICGDRPWVALHHFGDDGGQALKPSDNEAARCCTECHMAWDQKRRALLRMVLARPADPRPMDILDRFQNDALKLNRAYMEHLESVKRRGLPASRCEGCVQLVDGECVAEFPHVEPPNECALDELNLWLVTDGPGLGPDEQRDWLLGWANRRGANVTGFLLEPMQEIAAESNDNSSRFVAKRAIRTACLGRVEDGQDEDRLVR